MTPARILIDRIEVMRQGRDKPVLVAVDGWSASGKSTFAAQVADQIGAVVIDGDEFYAGGSPSEWDGMSPADKAGHCIDWRRQRPVLEALARGETASWHAYDWDSHDGSFIISESSCSPAPVVILEGVYSARPELADLFDLRVLYSAPAELRRRRWIEREGEVYLDEWARRWSEAETGYFTQVMTPEEFDLVLAAE
jgi:uridine kinase